MPVSALLPVTTSTSSTAVSANVRDPHGLLEWRNQTAVSAAVAAAVASWASTAFVRVMQAVKPSKISTKQCRSNTCAGHQSRVCAFLLHCVAQLAAGSTST